MTLYRMLVSSLFFPALLLLLTRRVKGEETWGQLAQRLGLSSAQTDKGVPQVWLHAASNGELNSALSLLDQIRKDYSDFAIIVTCNSLSGVELAQKNGYVAQLPPLDFRWSIKRFLKSRTILAYIAVESEIWPNRTHVLHDASIPCMLIGARLSSRSSRTWARFSRIAKSTLAKITYVSAQDTASKDRFVSLGVRTEAIGVTFNLKGLFQAKQSVVTRKSRATICLAASTHPKEDEIILEAYKSVRRSWPELRLIIAPRHPKRTSDIVLAIKAEGFEYYCRSEGHAFDASREDVFLADTLGEMDNWYAQSGICIIGGTFKDHRGHTPYEPTAYSCALVHGPHVDNFRSEFNALDASQASLNCENARSLSQALLFLKDEAAQEQRVKRAQVILNTEGDREGDGILELREAIHEILHMGERNHP